MIDSFSIKAKGYHPFLIKDGWQFARLNYTHEQHIDQITHLDAHLKTDEIFALIAERAMLNAATIRNGTPVFERELMAINKIYNIPQGVWHKIAMEPGRAVIIAESQIPLFRFRTLCTE